MAFKYFAVGVVELHVIFEVVFVFKLLSALGAGMC